MIFDVIKKHVSSSSGIRFEISEVDMILQIEAIQRVDFVDCVNPTGFVGRRSEKVRRFRWRVDEMVYHDNDGYRDAIASKRDGVVVWKVKSGVVGDEDVTFERGRRSFVDTLV